MAEFKFLTTATRARVISANFLFCLCLADTLVSQGDACLLDALYLHHRKTLKAYRYHMGTDQCIILIIFQFNEASACLAAKDHKSHERDLWRLDRAVELKATKYKVSSPLRHRMTAVGRAAVLCSSEVLLQWL